jgi:hypothetical protein
MEGPDLDSALGSIMGAWQHGVGDDYGARLDGQGRAMLMYDVMDFLASTWAPPLAPPLPPAALPLCWAGLEEPAETEDGKGQLSCVEGDRFANEDQLQELLGCWPHVRVFVGASSPDVSHERKFLLDFVLPALRVQACARRVSLSWADPKPWTDLSGDGGEEAAVAHASRVASARLRTMQACRICPTPPEVMEDGSAATRGQSQPLAVLVLGQRVGEPLAPGAALKDSLRRALAAALDDADDGGVARVESQEREGQEREGREPQHPPAGGACLGGEQFGWLQSELGEEEGRMLGPTDVDMMHAVLFREAPSAVVLLKMSSVVSDEKLEQLVREEPIRRLLVAAHAAAGALLEKSFEWQRGLFCSTHTHMCSHGLVC